MVAERRTYRAMTHNHSKHSTSASQWANRSSVRIYAAMSCFKSSHTGIIFVCFVVTSLLLGRYSDVDLRVSRMFFNDGFYLNSQWWVMLLNRGLAYFLYAAMLGVLAIYAFNRFAKRKAFGIDGKKVLYLCLVLVIGAGLIVNVILKENFGRARPRDLEEFGGTRHFTPAFVVTQECQRNCSFSSGHGAGGFFAVALALALSRKRATLVVALVFGSAVSLSRVASGAHFFSDSIVSFFVMSMVAILLYQFMFENVSEPSRGEANR